MKKKSEWDQVFTISALIYLMGAVVYGIFGTGEIQNWATRSSRDIEIKTHSSNNGASSSSSNVNNSKAMAVTDLGVITPPQNSSFALSESSFSVPAPSSTSTMAVADETRPIVKN